MKPHRLDEKISRRMQKIIKKVDTLIERQIGERCLVGLLVSPFAVDQKEADEGGAQLQYASNAPREFMFDAMASMVENWKRGVCHVPPHMIQEPSEPAPGEAAEEPSMPVRYRDSVDVECPLCRQWMTAGLLKLIGGGKVECPGCSQSFNIGRLVVVPKD
jgi:hypothetical protein